MAVGPTVKLAISCFDCEHCKTKGYSCQGDSGSGVYCNHGGTLRHVGDTSWKTPAWCPLRDKAIKAAIREM